MLRKQLREGENVPEGYAFVRYRPEMLGCEVAIMPFNFLFKFYHWLRKSAWRHMNEEEIRNNKLTLKIINERGERRRQEGYEQGRKDGETHMARFYVLLIEQATKMKRQVEVTGLVETKPLPTPSTAKKPNKAHPGATETET